MIRLATILFFLGASLTLFGQQALVSNLNGQWCIHSNGVKVELDRAIHELGNFDEAGLSYFMRHEKYGIINDKGEILLEEQYNSIKQLGSGYYILLDAEKNQLLANFQKGELQFRKVRFNKKIQPSWQQVILDSTTILINLSSHQEWILSETDKVWESDFDYVLCRIDTVTHFFGPEGNEIENEPGYPMFAQNYLVISNRDKKTIVYRTHSIDLPGDASSIRIRENEILYSQKGSSTIVSADDNKVVSVIPYENVTYYNDNLLMIQEKGMVGLIRKSGELLIPTKYSSISVLDGLYNVRKSTGAGILDRNGRELVPCKYNYIVAFSDFFKVHNNLRFEGLISRKTGKTLLPCDYSKLVLSDTVIRAFSGDMLRILKLDSNHRVLNDIVLSNVTSLVDTRASTDALVDERLYPLGWFLKNVPKYDTMGYLVGSTPRWGLKSSSDSVLIPANYKQPVFVDQADFSLLPSSPKKIKINGFDKAKRLQFQVISHRTGKRLVPEMVISVDTMDLLSRSYTRFFSEKGRGVLLDDNSILRVDYIDGNDARYVRYCSSRKTVIEPAKKDDFDALRFFDFDMNNDHEKWLQISLDRKNRDYVKYWNAKWNFLDTNGKKMFTDPFDFAYQYSQETAVVMKEGKWGVARADSLIIPVAFAAVNRSPISDTLFVVKRVMNGTRFLDTNGRLMTNGMTRFYKDKGSFAQIEIGRRKKLISQDYSVISGDTKFQKVLDNGIFFSKRNKKYTIFDKEGTHIGAVDLRPEAVWFDEYVLTKTRGKRGILSMENDTLIPFKYKKISKLGDYIFAQDGDKNLLYNADLVQLANLKANDVLVDQVTGSYASIDDSKATIFSSSQRKLRKLKGTKFELFHNGYLIEFGKKLRVLSLENEFIFDFQPKEINVMGENGYLVIDSDKVGHYFNEDWVEITFDEPLTRSEVVGEGLAISRSRNGTVLFGGDVRVKLKNGFRNNGEFRNGLLLLERMGNYIFVDVNGINQFKRTFDDALPFIGKYAAVKEKDGWTIIDGQGHFQILPSFDKIKPLSPTIFSTPSQPVYGLFDAHGNQIIPVEFQQLNFLRNDIIQGEKDGDIFYFDRFGNSIPLD